MLSQLDQNKIKSKLKNIYNFYSTNKKIDYYFERVYGAPNKKYKSIYKFKKENNLLIDSSNSIVIGDSKKDYEAAKKNNLPFIRICENDFEPWEINDRNLTTINNFSEIH